MTPVWWVECAAENSYLHLRCVCVPFLCRSTYR